MRKASTDKYVCFAMLIIFIYSFLIIGASNEYCTDRPYWGYNCREDEVVGLVWSSAVFIAPPVFIVFFFFMVFHKELEPVNRHWVKQEIRKGFKYLKWKYRDGKKKLEIWKALP